MLEYLHNQQEVTRLREKSIREDALEEGRQLGLDEGRQLGLDEGRQLGSLNILVSLYQKGIIDLDTAVTNSNVSKEEFLKCI